MWQNEFSSHGAQTFKYLKLYSKNSLQSHIKGKNPPQPSENTVKNGNL